MSYSEWKDYSNLRPLGNRVLVKRLRLPEVRESGLFVIGRDYPTMGRVVAKGDGPRLKRGYRVLGNVDALLNELEPKYWVRVCQGLRIGIPDIHKGDLVQWSVDSNFDLKQIGRTSQGEDLFLFDYDDLNFVGREE